MKRFSLSFLFPLITLVMLVLVLDRQVFVTPPLGTFLNPFVGVVQNEQTAINNENLTLGLEQEVEIIFDDRSIPHVFAQNQNDMFFAQGYVCASDRLWQMDFLSYTSAGRLSEILGEELLNHDRTQRRNGMLRSAQTSLDYIEQNKNSKNALDSYTAGVNAWIDQMSFKDYPVEYKLLDYSPELWTNLKSILIMKYMSAVLSGYEDDVSSSYMQMILGAEEYDKLFANYYLEDDSAGFSIHRALDSLPNKEYLDYPFLESPAEIQTSEFNSNLGSNSWVVGPEKSQNGNAILCNDPHLNLSLPAIWYEIQLKSAEQNVYGFSIPGVPGVIVGFNDHISWGLTNGLTDVRDYYKLSLTENYSHYKYDGKWVETEMVIEEIVIRNELPFYDTVFYSIHGPIFSDARFGFLETRGCAIDWSLHDPSNELLTFIELNRAKNYGEFKEAIKHYKCPVQNFSYADTDGNIAMHFQGKIKSNKFKDNGKFIMDGTSSACFTNEELKRDLPQAYNPNQGYVYSANNNPYNTLDSILIYGHYAALRADKINASLSDSKKFSIDDMQQMQLDNTNRLAELATPILLNLITIPQNDYQNRLAEWDFKYDKNSELALVFEDWWSTIRSYTWDELSGFKNINKLPNDIVLLDLIYNDPNNKYFDIVATEKIESAADIVTTAFLEIQNAPNRHDNWGDFNRLQIMHLSDIEAFSKTVITQGGHPNAINALSNNWGPTLRMVVEMGDKPQGYGIYAGGQSGNPGSANYDKFLDDWSNGVYYKLIFYTDKTDVDSDSGIKWVLK